MYRYETIPPPSPFPPPRVCPIPAFQPTSSASAAAEKSSAAASPPPGRSRPSCSPWTGSARHHDPAAAARPTTAAWSATSPRVPCQRWWWWWTETPRFAPGPETASPRWPTTASRSCLASTVTATAATATAWSWWAPPVPAWPRRPASSPCQ